MEIKDNAYNAILLIVLDELNMLDKARIIIKIVFIMLDLFDANLYGSH